MKQRPKLLFLAHSFPPMQTAACNRNWNVAKYLSRLNWEVTVVTPHPSCSTKVDDSRIQEDIDNDGIRRICTNYGWRILLEDNRNGPLGSIASRLCRKTASQLGIDKNIGWKKAVESACKNLSSRDVDLILATGPPYIAFRLAKRLSRRLGRPYVLDYRDAWTASPFVRRPRQAAVRRERILLESCAAVISVSRSSATALDLAFGVGSKSHVVTNGYDPEEMQKITPADFQYFAIVYTGSLIAPKRLITPVMAALRKLEDLGEQQTIPWKFHYYGPNGRDVHREAERFGIVDRIVLHGRVPRAEALSAVCGAGAAVVINSTADDCTMNDKGVIPGKVYDPLGLGTPILLVSPKGSDICEVLADSSASKSVSGSDIEGMTQFLAGTMRNHSKHSSRSNSLYSWPMLARKLDVILKDVVGDTPTDRLDTREYSLPTVNA